MADRVENEPGVDVPAGVGASGGSSAERRERAGLHTISEVTARYGVTARTLRFYEQEGFLAPLRQGQHRLYSVRELTRLKLILRGKRLGFSLAEIADILDMYDAAPGEAGQLAHLIDRIGERRAQLAQKLADIEATLADLDRVEAGCRKRLAEVRGTPASEHADQ